MTIEQTNELNNELEKYYPELRFEKERLKVIKKILEKDFASLKESAEENDEDFYGISVDGVMLQEKKTVNYTWKPQFYEDIINTGYAHMLLKHGDKLKERFNLSNFALPKNPDNESLHFSPKKRDSKQMAEEETLLEFEKIQWSNISLEQKVDTYMRIKRKLELKEKKYELDKIRLLKLMKENDLQKIGFYTIKEEDTQYDFTKLYNAELEETVMLATNGAESIDLFNFKPTDLILDDLFHVERIQKRYGATKVKQLEEALGENFYYVMGSRIENDIMSRFPISTQKVEEAIELGYLEPDILKHARSIESEEDIKFHFEIITEVDLKKRKEMYNEMLLERGLRVSGYYDTVS